PTSHAVSSFPPSLRRVWKTWPTTATRSSRPRPACTIGSGPTSGPPPSSSPPRTRPGERSKLTERLIQSRAPTLAPHWFRSPSPPANKVPPRAMALPTFLATPISNDSYVRSSAETSEPLSARQRRQYSVRAKEPQTSFGPPRKRNDFHTSWGDGLG